ncbi:sensor histidine kinase [Streptomyces sp. SID8381]|uniref:ATP-binding protein n=1 Tax=unclassified Streptomyces TaxID=2593676 RepID=UPI0003A62335|nr:MULTISPECIES: ATP-binding protein [unclassified Streptomyces]MYX27455.1 sensor histidine kinase [Streptomyces sp. SID8381]
MSADSPVRPAAVRGHRRRPLIDEFTLGRIRRAAAIPLLALVAVLAVGLVLWRVVEVPGGRVLAGLVCGCVVVAVVAVREARAAAQAVQRADAGRLDADLAVVLDRLAAAQKTVLWSTDELCRGRRPPIPAAADPRSAGPAAGVEAALSTLQTQAVIALLRVHDESGAVVLLEVLRRLAMREHVLVGRALEALSELERLTDDPELLARIFQIDHLVTRVRRQVESTAVLGGQSLRTGRTPLSVATVLRGAVSEVVQYPRVSTTAGAVGTELGLPAHVGPDLMHLLAELIENSCENSDPATRVVVRAQQVPAGLAIEVEDRAVAMAPELRERMNALLAAPDDVDVSGQVRAGRIGLLTAAKIGRRHGLSIRLQENMTGGTTALVVVPTSLLVKMPSGGGASRSARPRPVPPASSASAAAAPPPARVAEAVSAGEPPLPRRTRTHGALRPDSGQQQETTTAATPGLAAAFLGATRRGAGSPSPQATPPEQSRRRT